MIFALYAFAGFGLIFVLGSLWFGIANYIHRVPAVFPEPAQSESQKKDGETLTVQPKPFQSKRRPNCKPFVHDFTWPPGISLNTGPTHSNLHPLEALEIEQYLSTHSLATTRRKFKLAGNKVLQLMRRGVHWSQRPEWRAVQRECAAKRALSEITEDLK